MVTSSILHIWIAERSVSDSHKHAEMAMLPNVNEYEEDYGVDKDSN